MGSYNVACGLSSLSINEGEKAGLVVLKPTPPPVSEFISLRLYIHDLFVPVTAPIWGEYADYGELQNLEHNTSAEHLLACLPGLSLETIVSWLTSYHEGVYEHNGFVITPDALTTETRESDSETHQMLQMGFVQDGETFTHGKIVFTLTEAGKLYYEGKRQESLREALNTASAATGIFPGYSKQLSETLKELITLRGMFLHKELFETLKEGSFGVGARKLGYAKTTLQWFEKNPDYYYMPSNSLIAQSLRVPPAELSPRFSQALEEIVVLNGMMQDSSRLYEPSLNGPQYGDDDFLAALYAAGTHIINERNN